MMIWLLAFLSVVGVVLNVRKDRRGFIFWMVSNAGWIVIDWMHGIYAQSVLFMIYFFLALWGWFRWKK